MDRVIYASYGSNMCHDRFICYIKGGTLPGMSFSYPGCRNRELYKNDRGEYASIPLATNYELYFGRDNKHWDPTPHERGGGANIDTTPLAGQGYIREFKPDAEPIAKLVKARETVMRGHVVTREQFMDIFHQENLGDIDAPLDAELLDYANESHPLLNLHNRIGENAIGTDEPIEINITSDYDTLLYLGNISIEGDSLPAYTFTTRLSKREAMKDPDDAHFIAPPGDAYFNILATGLREIGDGHDGWNDESIHSYLHSKID